MCLELLEDAVEEMSEDLALPIAIVLIVGFLGNKSFQTYYSFFHIYFIYMFKLFYAWQLSPGTASPAILPSPLSQSWFKNSHFPPTQNGKRVGGKYLNQ